MKFQSNESQDMKQPFNHAVALANFCIKHIIAVFGTCDVKPWGVFS